MAKKYCYDKILMNFFFGGGREDDNKRRQENGQSFSLFVKTAFLGHILKNQHIRFLVHGHSLVHIGFTPSEGPKGFVSLFFKKSDHESWTMKLDHGKRLSSMVRLQGPWCKPTLSIVWFTMYITILNSSLLHPMLTSN